MYAICGANKKINGIIPITCIRIIPKTKHLTSTTLDQSIGNKKVYIRPFNLANILLLLNSGNVIRLINIKYFVNLYNSPSINITNDAISNLFTAKSSISIVTI